MDTRCLEAKSGSTAAVPAFFHSYQAASSATVLSASTISYAGPTNASVFANVAQNFRVVAASMRITVRFAATTPRGVMYAFFLPDETQTNVELLTFNQLMSLPCAVPLHCTSSGELGGDVTYRPDDASSFEFVGAVDPQPGVNTGKIVFVGLWPASTSTTYDAYLIEHVECQSGLDAGQLDSGGPQESLSSAGVSIDEAGAMAAQSDPVTPSIELIDMLDAANSTFMRGSQRMGLSSSGGLSGFVNTQRGILANSGPLVSATSTDQVSLAACAASSAATPPNTPHGYYMVAPPPGAPSFQRS